LTIIISPSLIVELENTPLVHSFFFFLIFYRYIHRATIQIPLFIISLLFLTQSIIISLYFLGLSCNVVSTTSISFSFRFLHIALPHKCLAVPIRLHHMHTSSDIFGISSPVLFHTTPMTLLKLHRPNAFFTSPYNSIPLKSFNDRRGHYIYYIISFLAHFSLSLFFLHFGGLYW
jgi:hypothetical protein